MRKTIYLLQQYTFYHKIFMFACEHDHCKAVYLVKFLKAFCFNHVPLNKFRDIYKIKHSLAKITGCIRRSAKYLWKPLGISSEH